MSSEPLRDSLDAAKQVARELDRLGQEYALGGALALGFWGTPRGTLDVDVTLFVPKEQPEECVRVLRAIGCELNEPEALASLREHGFCRTRREGITVDVFVPLIEFYDTAKARRKRLFLEEQPAMFWDAETLSIFKMMFFREKDLADVRQILTVQGSVLDRIFIRTQLNDLYGRRDPRLAAWDRLVTEVPLASETT